MFGFGNDPPAAEAEAPVVIARRMVRSDEDVWSRTRSCVGGQPAIAKAVWPRRMHCIAQLDLSEIHGSVARLPYPLPESGLLLFFADTGSFSGSRHGGAVRHVAIDDLSEEADPPARVPLYGSDWAYSDITAGSVSHHDAPIAFPRWPLTFVQARQAFAGEDAFTPNLDAIVGISAESVHLDIDDYAPSASAAGGGSVAANVWRYPVRAASAILRDMLHVVLKYQAEAPSSERNAIPILIGQIRISAEAVRQILDCVEYWEGIFSTLDPDRPLDVHLAQAFAVDLYALERRVRRNGKQMRFGAGTSVTQSAALQSYFEMYRGDRRSFDAIPGTIREQIETRRMRSAYGPAVHQLFGHGSNPQDNDADKRGKVLLFQAATDEAVGFMWGDVGVLQYWIAPDHLAEGRWDQVEFYMGGN